MKCSTPSEQRKSGGVVVEEERNTNRIAGAGEKFSLYIYILLPNNIKKCSTTYTTYINKLIILTQFLD
jgi:hypothetical protein